MTKKCMGCGIVLQDTSPYTLGYTPRLENDYCERCFKITHYNAKIDASLAMNNEELIVKINEKKAFVIFLCDFLNLHEEIFSFYRKITCSKMLVVTKSDIIPKNIGKHKVLDRIKSMYGVKEDILLCSVKTKENLTHLMQMIQQKKKVLMAGATNSGKSSLINHLIGANITVSKNSNTTLDFISLSFDDFTIYDAPGFIPSSFIDSMTPKGYIKPISYQLQSKYSLQFLNIVLASDVDNNITLYFNNLIQVEKRRIVDALVYDLEVPFNSDVIIKGLGFIHVTKSCLLYLNIDRSLVEVRSTLVGGNHE
ncbi:MAG: 50S ribosome-binding GTPase [Bacilli bacterium]|nr:50S ribosome-binding GTPase [Bacilli bacterium]